MQIKYNPAIDLCCAMLQYAHWEELSGTYISGYSVSPELKQWYERTKNSIPGLLHNDIGFLVRNFIGLLFIPIELAVEEQITDPGKLISAFSRLEPEGLPERLFNSYLTGYDWNEVKDQPDKIKNAIEKAGGTTRQKEPQFFIDFSHGPEAVQRRLSGIMTDFYRFAVKPFEKETIRMMEIQAAAEQKQLDEDPSGFFSAVLKINRKKNEPEPKLYLSCYSEIDVLQTDNPFAIIYGKSRSRFPAGIGIPVDQIYNLLADESRRSILRILCRRTLFIRELADELELTSATVSYHMSRLGALGLVRNERGERKRVYYSADMKKVKDMMRTLESDLLGE